MIALDIDGTLLDYNYIPGQQAIINHALIAELAAAGVKQVALVTNQGGLPFGWQQRNRTDGRKYPAPSDFASRLSALREALKAVKIEIISLDVSLFHPKADAGLVDGVRDILWATMEDADLQFPSLAVYIAPEYRKPSPVMLKYSGATVYYGDSDEDAEAAAAAGIEFRRVARFMGA